MGRHRWVSDVVKMESEEVRVREVNSGTPGRGRIPHRGHTNAEETTSEKSEAAKVDAKAYVSAIEKRQGRFCPSRPRLVLNSSFVGLARILMRNNPGVYSGT